MERAGGAWGGVESGVRCLGWGGTLWGAGAGRGVGAGLGAERGAWDGRGARGWGGAGLVWGWDGTWGGVKCLGWAWGRGETCFGARRMGPGLLTARHAAQAGRQGLPERVASGRGGVCGDTRYWRGRGCSRPSKRHSPRKWAAPWLDGSLTGWSRAAGLPARGRGAPTATTTWRCVRSGPRADGVDLRMAADSMDTSRGPRAYRIGFRTERRRDPMPGDHRAPVGHGSHGGRPVLRRGMS